MAKCSGARDAENAQAYIAFLSNSALLEGLERHADPQFWKDHADVTAYLRRWGCYLRREARKRGLL